MNAPLADRIRPKTLDDVVGQQHILGPNKVLRRIIESGTIPNMVFYGPSGVGKTTVASIIAKQSHMHLCKLNSKRFFFNDRDSECIFNLGQRFKRKVFPSFQDL